MKRDKPGAFGLMICCPTVRARRSPMQESGSGKTVGEEK
jgi:hypothetical protein